ncbi:predicted protein [Naegleria gruberi]|uniref:Predicted protein n=1 Tax=Naegleria gruberi TaxID=5762 RepID=D2VT12_NAEGR|nr:uncharacterized protein NAEGRDRAFT_52022 [Naegleria gruberi]EFC40003.1 predicted protein [Naegleria gruberi]|eukprot:XP_002672747.1 predicted protein [Naegleria gruberi strain NEG-M]
MGNNKSRNPTPIPPPSFELDFRTIKEINQEKFVLHPDLTFEMATNYLEIGEILQLALSCKLLYSYLWFDQEKLWNAVARRDGFTIRQHECKQLYRTLRKKEISLLENPKFSLVSLFWKPEFVAEFGNIELNQLIYILRNPHFHIMVKANLIEFSLKQFITSENYKKLKNLLYSMCRIENGTNIILPDGYLERPPSKITLLSLLCKHLFEIPGADDIIIRFAPFGLVSEEVNKYSSVFTFEKRIILILLEKCKRKEPNLDQYFTIFTQIFEKKLHLLENFYQFKDLLDSFQTLDIEKITPTLIHLLSSNEKLFPGATLLDLHVYHPKIVAEISKLSHLPCNHSMNYILKYLDNSTFSSQEQLAIPLDSLFQIWGKYGKMISQYYLRRICELDFERTVNQILECEPVSFCSFDWDNQRYQFQYLFFLKQLENHVKTLDSSEYGLFFQKLKKVSETIHQNSKGEGYTKILNSILFEIERFASQYPFSNSLKKAIERDF